MTITSGPRPQFGMEFNGEVNAAQLSLLDMPLETLEARRERLLPGVTPMAFLLESAEEGFIDRQNELIDEKYGAQSSLARLHRVDTTKLHDRQVLLAQQALLPTRKDRDKGRVEDVSELLIMGRDDISIRRELGSRIEGSGIQPLTGSMKVPSIVAKELTLARKEEFEAMGIFWFREIRRMQYDSSKQLASLLKLQRETS